MSTAREVSNTIIGALIIFAIVFVLCWSVGSYAYWTTRPVEGGCVICEAKERLAWNLVHSSNMRWFTAEMGEYINSPCSDKQCGRGQHSIAPPVITVPDVPNFSAGAVYEGD